MAAVERLKQTKDLKLALLQKMVEGSQRIIDLDYDALSDTLNLWFVSRNTPTIVHYINEYVALLYQPDTNEVVGIQVEDFQAGFVNKHANVKKAWKLSSLCQELNIENLGDISLVLDRQKPVVAREIARVTENILHPRPPRHRAPVPAD